jgi:hypothetical protein
MYTFGYSDRNGAEIALISIGLREVCALLLGPPGNDTFPPVSLAIAVLTAYFFIEGVFHFFFLNGGEYCHTRPYLEISA